MVTIIFPVAMSKGFYEEVGFLVFTSSDTLNLQCRYLTDEEREEMLSQDSKAETDCEVHSMVRNEICVSEELSLFLESCELVALPASRIA